MAQQNEMNSIVLPADGHFGFSDTPDTDANIVKIASGAGNPSDVTQAWANGSMYLKTDAANRDDALWQRIGGSWVALDGEP